MHVAQTNFDGVATQRKVVAGFKQKARLPALVVSAGSLTLPHTARVDHATCRVRVGCSFGGHTPKPQRVVLLSPSRSTALHQP